MYSNVTTQQSGKELMPKDAAGNIEFQDTDYLETWIGMEFCRQQGMARSIGVSNFNSEQLERLVNNAHIMPVEVTLNLNQKPLLEVCKKLNITVTGFSPLGRPGNRHGIKNLWDEPEIQELAKKYNKSCANIACRFLLERGVTPIPKSVTPSRIKENFDIFNFNLTAEEISRIEAMETGIRTATFGEAKDSLYYPFKIPF
ncbi:1,5-anhydro-D-fructose reductase-like [Trichogramma pretiosum]|uniref:1,5-anhydro-D-fructose reductase-like n=1 Tax=Trichogramma pretiosum TaxID=7493 RepID=UPI000C71A987|nr:1,5-anhydro-D-fructose reductase-like [Trichogramma pretiosum]